MALTTVPASLSATALTLTTAAQPNITSVGTLTGLTVSGNIAGTLTTAAQTNITSVGTLTGLNTTGDITVTKSSARVRAIESGGATTQIASGGSTGYVGTYSNDPLQILSNSTAAITIDTSQNVTFGGHSITVDPSGGGDAVLALIGAADAQTLRIDQNSIRTTSNSDINIFTNGNSGQLFLDQSTNRVGIGTTSPAQLFHVSAGASASTAVRFGQNYDTSVEIGPVTATASGMIKFLNASGTSKVSMGFRDSGSGSDGAFRIRRGATLDSSGPLFNFGTSGEVEIIKSSVSSAHADSFATLYVQDAEARLQLMSANTGDNASTVLLSNVNKHWGMHHHGPDGNNIFSIGYHQSSSSGTDISNALTDMFNIDTSGHVGVGLNAPAHSGLGNMVSVNTGNLIGVGTSGAYLGFNMYYNSGSWKYQVGGAGSAILSFANSGDFSLRQATTGSSAGDTISYSETFKINRSTGYVDATGASQVRLSLGSTGTPGTNSANWIRGNSGLLEFNCASSGFNWEVGGNQKMKLNSSGNLAIGAGHDETRRNLGLIGSTPGVHFIDSNVTNLRHEIVGGGNAGLELSADYNNVGTGYIRFDVGGQERARITEAGHIRMQNGGGIDFSSHTPDGSGGSLAGSQEVLDDYEEGTFTPQFHVEGQGAATAAGAYGQYVKVGNVCHVTLESGTLSNIPNPNAYRAWEFRNLPFTSNSHASQITPISVRVTGLADDADYGIQGFLYNNANHGRIEVRTQRSAQNSSTFMNGAECRIQVTYRTA